MHHRRWRPSLVMKQHVGLRSSKSTSLWWWKRIKDPYTTCIVEQQIPEANELPAGARGKDQSSCCREAALGRRQLASSSWVWGGLGRKGVQTTSFQASLSSLRYICPDYFDTASLLQLLRSLHLAPASSLSFSGPCCTIVRVVYGSWILFHRLNYVLLLLLELTCCFITRQDFTFSDISGCCDVSGWKITAMTSPYALFVFPCFLQIAFYK